MHLHWLALWLRASDGTWMRLDRAGRVFWFRSPHCTGIPFVDAPADLGALEGWMRRRGFERAELALEVTS